MNIEKHKEMTPIRTLIPEPVLQQKCLLHITKIRGDYWVRNGRVGYVSRRGLHPVIVKTPAARQIASNAVSSCSDTRTAHSNCQNIAFQWRIRRHACCVRILQR